LVETELSGSTSRTRKCIAVPPTEDSGTDMQVPSFLCWTPNSDIPTGRQKL